MLENSTHLGMKIIILSNQVKHYLHQAAEEEGISGSQSRILHFLVTETEKREVYQKDVEERFFLRRSTVAHTLQGMEKSGLITRCSVEKDARLKKLMPTKQGRDLNDRIGSRVEAMEWQLISKLSLEEIEIFNQTVSKISDSMTEIGVPTDYCRPREAMTEKGETTC